VAGLESQLISVIKRIFYMVSRLILLFSMALSGCTSLSKVYLESAELVKSSYLITTGETSRSSQWVLPRGTRFYLARNNVLTELNLKYSDELTAVITAAIGHSFRHAAVGLLPESLPQALASADRLATDFLIFPSIMVWDNSASTWSETFAALRSDNNTQTRPQFGLDSVQLQLVVMHAATGKVFDVVRIDSSSGVLTLYEDTPDKVVLPELKSFFAGLVAASG
jgi:hypothetical protein